VSLRKGEMGVSVEFMTKLCEIKERAEILARTVLDERSEGDQRAQSVILAIELLDIIS